MGLGFALT